MDLKTLQGHALFTAQEIGRFGGGHPETRILEIVGR
jgi:hypothetical protein